MVIGDANFPFPDPSFLFIHCVTIRPVLTTSADSRGKPMVTYDEDEDWQGYLTSPDPNNEDSGGTDRVRWSAVLLLPRTCTVPLENALVRCTDSQLSPNLAGTYLIEVVRPNISHTRCLLSRYGDVWEEHKES